MKVLMRSHENDQPKKAASMLVLLIRGPSTPGSAINLHDRHLFESPQLPSDREVLEKRADVRCAG